MNVVITGCSRGIGLELVKKFTNEGHKVFGISRNIQPLNQLSISSNLLFPFSFDIYKGDYQELWRSNACENVNRFLTNELRCSYWEGYIFQTRIVHQYLPDGSPAIPDVSILKQMIGFLTS